MSYYNGNSPVKQAFMYMLIGYAIGQLLPIWALLGTAQKSLDSIEKQNQVQTQTKVRR